MILRQFLHRDPVAISYLLGCVGHGVAIRARNAGGQAPAQAA